MKHADRVIERILYLGGVPNMQRLSPVRVGEEPIEMHSSISRWSSKPWRA